MQQQTKIKPAVALGQDIYGLIERLYPICRSITGAGVRETLDIIREHVPIQVHEVASGTKAFDWTVPKEWNIKDAYVANSRGEKVIDWRQSNLRLMSYSVPVNLQLSLVELKRHLHTLPEHPDWIPYRTSYYQEDWGFCLTQNELEAMREDTYTVVIDATLEPGSLTYGELLVPGKRQDEVLLSTYICHPSLCNDNLSGVALLTMLAKNLAGQDLNYSYRFLFIPETIGALVWLSRNENKLAAVKHGLVATCVGDAGPMTYKKSRRGDAEIDRVVEKVLKDAGSEHEIIDFFPTGSDERQFCSPGFNMPVGSLMRTRYDKFDEYHTSADNLELMDGEGLADSAARYLEVISVLERNAVYINKNPKGEPMLGKRGLYDRAGGQRRMLSERMALLWVLNLSDGKNSLLDISIRAGLHFNDIAAAAVELLENNLLELAG